MSDNIGSDSSTLPPEDLEANIVVPEHSMWERNDSKNKVNSLRISSENKDDVPLWLITFTDVMALMLTFFVLLYSMSVPQEDKWEVMSTAMTQKVEVFDAKAFSAGSQDVISIDKISTSKALDLHYLKTLTANLLKEKGIEDVLLIENRERVIISLPSELLFDTGTDYIGIEGKQLLFELGGILTRIKNRIEVVGHSDPRPINNTKGRYATNWELSLARAASVSSMLKTVGYDRPVTIRGLSSARFDELPDTIEEEKRLSLSRRVDIMVMDDAGYRKNAFDIK